MQPRQEVLACSPLAADALLLDAFYEDNMRSLPEEWEPFLSNRQLALQRGLQGRWEEAVRLEPLPLLVTLRGKALYVKGDYTVAIEVLRDACRSAADAGYPHLMLSCRLWMGAKDKAENEQHVNFLYPDTAPFQEAMAPLHGSVLEANPELQPIYDRIQEYNAEYTAAE